MNTESLNSLLAPDESPAFTLVNPDGDAPLMIACDHASNAIPRSLSGLEVDPKLLELHIAYDIGARQVATLLSRRFNASLLLANYSRLVLDLNRYVDDSGSIPEISDAHLIVANQHLTEAGRQQRVATLFDPYHQVHGEMVQRLKQVYRKPIILSVHSFTPALQGATEGEVRPWHVGVLWDKDKALAERLIENLSQQVGISGQPLVVGDNEPYHAHEPSGYSMFEHGEKQGVEMALLEIRQDLIADEKGQQWAADIVYDALSPLLDSTII